MLIRAHYAPHLITLSSTAWCPLRPATLRVTAAFRRAGQANSRLDPGTSGIRVGTLEPRKVGLALTAALSAGAAVRHPLVRGPLANLDE